MGGKIKVPSELVPSQSNKIMLRSKYVHDDVKGHDQEYINNYLEEKIESKVIEAGGVNWDSVPTAGSNNAVKSKDIKAALEKVTGYFVLDSNILESTVAKTVTVADFPALAIGGSIKIKMLTKNTATNPTLRIGASNAPAYPLYYNNERASASNSWEANEVISVYFDGTNYQASNAQGGGNTGKKEVALVPGYYDTTNAASQEIAPTTITSHQYIKCAKIAVKEGDVVLINGKGTGNSNVWLWATIDTNDNYADGSNNQNEGEGVVVIIPAGISYIVVNCDPRQYNNPSCYHMKAGTAADAFLARMAEYTKYDNSQSGLSAENTQEAIDNIVDDVESITQDEMNVSWVDKYQDGDTLRNNNAVIHAFGSAAEGNIIVRTSADYIIHSIYVYASPTYNIPVSSSTSHYEKFNPYGKRFVVNVKRMDGENITTAEGSNVDIIASNGVIPFVKKSYEKAIDCVWLQGVQANTYTANAKLIHTLPIMANGRTTIECSDDYFIHSVYAYDGDGYNIFSTQSQYMEFELVGKPFVVNIKRNDSADISPSEGSNIVIKTENTLLDKRDVFGDAILMGGILYNNGSIVTTSRNIYLLPFISIDGAVNARIIYKGKYLTVANRYYGENGNYLGKDYTSAARYWRCTADLGEDADIDAVSENTVILVNGKTFSNNNGVLHAENIRYYDGTDFNNTLQQVIDSIPLAYRNKTLMPEDFEGNTIEEQIANMNEFLVTAGGHFNIYFGKTLKTYTINKAIILPSNTTMIIDGCKVKLNTRIHDNVFRTANIVENVTNKYDYGSVSGVLNNIHIIGLNDAVIEGVDEYYEGVVHGPASSPSSAEGTTQTFNSQWYGWHGNLIYLQSVDGFSVSGVKLTKNCGWCTNFAGCYNGEIHDIDIDSRASNGDGIDILAGSHDIKVWNIWNHSQDDTVAIGTAGVDRISAGFEYLPSFVLPPDSNEYLNKSPVYNIEVSHVHSTSDISHNVCFVAWTDIEIHHVYISDIAGFNGKGASDYNIVFWGNHWYTGYTDGNYHHIFVNNIDATYAKGAISIEGMPHDSWFNNIKKGTAATDAIYKNISGINPGDVGTRFTNLQE